MDCVYKHYILAVFYNHTNDKVHNQLEEFMEIHISKFSTSVLIYRDVSL